MGERLRVLIVEGSVTGAAQLGPALTMAGVVYHGQRVGDGRALRAALEQPWVLVLCSDVVPELPLTAARGLVEERDPFVPFIVVSDGGEAAVLAALRAGAHDFVTHGDAAGLAEAVERSR